MNTSEFIRAYRESRNGANGFFFNPLYRSMAYSDGVKECAEAGCYWLLDIIGTECLKPLRAAANPMGIVEVTVAGGKAKVTLTDGDDEPPLWNRAIDYTDMPEGSWTFYLADEGERFSLILPSEY